MWVGTSNLRIRKASRLRSFEEEKQHCAISVLRDDDRAANSRPPCEYAQESDWPSFFETPVLPITPWLDVITPGSLRFLL